VKKLIILIFSICFVFAGDKEPLNLGYWLFKTYNKNILLKSTRMCIDYKRFWQVSKLKKVPGCKVRLIRNSRNRKTWSVNCNFRNSHTRYKGIVIYDDDYFEQRYTIFVKGQRIDAKTIARLLTRGTCPPNARYYAPSGLMLLYGGVSGVEIK